MNVFKLLVIIFTYIAGGGGSQLAYAGPVIGIGSMYDFLPPGTQSVTKRIYNTGDSTAFVRVEVLEIKFAGNGAVNEEKQKSISEGEINREKLIVTPMRLIIPSGGFQSARIIWPASRNTERYFRVRFSPVVPEAGDGFGLDREGINEYRKESLQAGVNVLTGYGTIVIVQPEMPNFNTVTDAGENKVTVRNKGNATVVLENVRQCRAANTDCGDTGRQVILPGRTNDLDKKPGYNLNFTLVEGTSKRMLSF